MELWTVQTGSGGFELCRLSLLLTSESRVVWENQVKTDVLDPGREEGNDTPGGGLEVWRQQPRKWMLFLRLVMVHFVALPSMRLDWICE